MFWMRNASANFRCLAHELNWELPDVWVDFLRVMLRLWAFECRSLGIWTRMTLSLRFLQPVHPRCCNICRFCRTLNWIDHFFVLDFIYIRYFQYAYIYVLLSLNTEHPWFHNFITPKTKSRKRGFSRSELVINKWTAACLRRNEALDAPWLDTRISALKREGAQPRDQCGVERGSAK